MIDMAFASGFVQYKPIITSARQHQYTRFPNYCLLLLRCSQTYLRFPYNYPLIDKWKTSNGKLH
jgi:hypothetical protein